MLWHQLTSTRAIRNISGDPKPLTEEKQTRRAHMAACFEARLLMRKLCRGNSKNESDEGQSTAYNIKAFAQRHERANCNHQRKRHAGVW